MIYHSGTALSDEKLVSNGGRVLTVTGLGQNLAEARTKAYQVISDVILKNSFYRSDIALIASRGE
jgi:phosphoribosylamine--glycine ligase